MFLSKIRKRKKRKKKKKRPFARLSSRFETAFLQRGRNYSFFKLKKKKKKNLNNLLLKG